VLRGAIRTLAREAVSDRVVGGASEVDGDVAAEVDRDRDDRGDVCVDVAQAREVGPGECHHEAHAGHLREVAKCSGGRAREALHAGHSVESSLTLPASSSKPSRSMAPSLWSFSSLYDATERRARESGSIVQRRAVAVRSQGGSLLASSTAIWPSARAASEDISSADAGMHVHVSEPHKDTLAGGSQHNVNRNAADS
jgi:hypothetical protein